jgi:hypothetical protein
MKTIPSDLKSSTHEQKWFQLLHVIKLEEAALNYYKCDDIDSSDYIDNNDYIAHCKEK